MSLSETEERLDCADPLAEEGSGGLSMLSNPVDTSITCRRSSGLLLLFRLRFLRLVRVGE